MYHCEFEEGLLADHIPARVRIWTLVHGQLISHANVNVNTYLRVQDGHVATHDPVDQPPTQHPSRDQEVSDLSVEVEVRQENHKVREDPCAGETASLKSSARKKSSVYSKRSASESNLVSARRTERLGRAGKFNRKAGNRQSMPQAYTNYGLSLDKDTSQINL